MMGTFLIFIYRIIGGYVIVAMFVSLIDESYEDTQEEVEKTHANDVFVANLAIQKNKLQGFLHARFPKVIPEPPKFTMTLRHIARDKELKAKNRYHLRSTREILTDLEHRLHRMQIQMLRSGKRKSSTSWDDWKTGDETKKAVKKETAVETHDESA